MVSAVDRGWSSVSMYVNLPIHITHIYVHITTTKKYVMTKNDDDNGESNDR